jgi:predicted oxidoreductase
LKPLDEPPFVALDCRIDHCFYASFTLGGLETLPTGEVLDTERNIIPGLFAARTHGLRAAALGRGLLVGPFAGDATFFGREPGKRATLTLRHG